MAKQPPAVRRILRAMQAAVRAAAPKAEEVFSYGIPGWRIDGRPLVWIAGWKAHVSIYPIGASIVKQHAYALGDATFSKGTVRFPLASPPGATLIRKLVRSRLTQVKEGLPIG